ncbi:MAG: retroviral-like aspartic protease family protein [Pyrinomonadaceae bacterium]
MPILHVQYDGQGQTSDGKTVKIPPAVALQQRGPVVQIIVGIAQTFADQLLQQGATLPTPFSGVALIDTGASVTCIDDAIAQNIGLPVIDVVTMASASHASTQQNVYPIHMQIVGSPIRGEVANAIGANLQSQGIIALIGRDFLQYCTLHYNGLTGAITLSI